jgi:hypothetical protein
MKVLLKLAAGKLFSGLSWLFQSIIEHWKIWAIVATVGYVFLLNKRVREFAVQNDTLSDIVYKQDSTIVAVRSRYMVDSINLVEREISMQTVVAQLRNQNKRLEIDLINNKQLVKDLADGIKCKNIFGKIVDCKK